MTIMAMNVLMSILDQEQYWSRSSNRASSSYRERQRFHIGNHFYSSYALYEKKNRIAGYLLLSHIEKKMVAILWSIILDGSYLQLFN